MPALHGAPATTSGATALFDLSSSSVSTRQQFDFNDGVFLDLGDDNYQSDSSGCSGLQSRHVRLSNPGSVENNVARLYYNYEGVPSGRTKLQVFWDWENHPGIYQMVDIGFGEVQRDDDTLSDFNGVVEHVYRDIVGNAQRVVRAILKGKIPGGDCVTVRHIRVSSPDLPSPNQPADACVAPPGGQVNTGLTTTPPLLNRPTTFPGPGGGVCHETGFPLSPYSVRTFQNCTGSTATLQVNVASPSCDPSGILIYLYGNPGNPQDPQPFDVNVPCDNLLNSSFAVDNLSFAGIPPDARVSVVVTHASASFPSCGGGVNVAYGFN